MPLHDRPPSGCRSAGSRPRAGGEAAGPRASGCPPAAPGWRCRAKMLSTSRVHARGSARRRRCRRRSRAPRHRPPPPPPARPAAPAARNPDELPVAVVVAAREPGPHAARGRRAASSPLKGARRSEARRACAPGSARSATGRKRSRRDRRALMRAPIWQAGMLGNDLAILTDDDPIGVGPHIPPAARTARGPPTLYRLLSKRTRQVLDTAASVAWKPSKGAARYAIRKACSSSNTCHTRRLPLCADTFPSRNSSATNRVLLRPQRNHRPIAPPAVVAGRGRALGRGPRWWRPGRASPPSAGARACRSATTRR